MRASLTLDFRNPPQWRKPWKEHWEDCLFLLTEGEAMGFHSLLVQEHFFTDDGYGPSVPIFLAVLAERTKTVRIGSWIQILALHNPAKLAQEICVLDHLSGGRLDIGVALGHRAAEFRAMQMSEKTRRSRFEEGFEILKKALTQSPFSHEGQYYKYNNVIIEPRPLQQPHPPIWVGATTTAAAVRAGRLGAHLYAGTTDPEAFAAYRAALEEAGHDPAQFRTSMSLSLTMTKEHPDTVWQRIREQSFYKWDFYRQIREELGDPMLSVGMAGAKIDPESYRANELIGDKDLVLETIRQMKDDLGVSDIIVFGGHAGTDLRGHAYESQKMFAEEVLPVIADW